MNFGEQAADPRQRRIAIGFVIAVHGVAIWGLANGLTRQAGDKLPEPIQMQILTEKQVPDLAPPPPPTLEVATPAFIPSPEISIQQSPPAQTAITAVSVDQPTTPSPPVTQVSQSVLHIAPVVDERHCGEPPYPPVSERLGEAGTVEMALLVGIDGKVVDSRIERSSGFSRLDKAAVNGLSLCRFTPGTIDGVPTPGWAQIRYEFRPRG